VENGGGLNFVSVHEADHLLSLKVFTTAHLSQLSKNNSLFFQRTLLYKTKKHYVHRLRIIILILLYTHIV
jgi:hypothetical protein